MNLNFTQHYAIYKDTDGINLRRNIKVVCSIFSKSLLDDVEDTSAEASINNA